MNRVSVRIGKEPLPTGQRDFVTRLLPPFESRHFSNLEQVKVKREVGRVGKIALVEYKMCNVRVRGRQVMVILLVG